METAADGGCEDYWCSDGDGGGGADSRVAVADAG